MHLRLLLAWIASSMLYTQHAWNALSVSSYKLSHQHTVSKFVWSSATERVGVLTHGGAVHRVTVVACDQCHDLLLPIVQLSLFQVPGYFLYNWAVRAIDKARQPSERDLKTPEELRAEEKLAEKRAAKKERKDKKKGVRYMR